MTCTLFRLLTQTPIADITSSGVTFMSSSSSSITLPSTNFQSVTDDIVGLFFTSFVTPVFFPLFNDHDREVLSPVIGASIITNFEVQDNQSQSKVVYSLSTDEQRQVQKINFQRSYVIILVIILIAG